MVDNKRIQNIEIVLQLVVAVLVLVVAGFLYLLLTNSSVDSTSCSTALDHADRLLSLASDGFADLARGGHNAEIIGTQTRLEMIQYNEAAAACR